MQIFEETGKDSETLYLSSEHSAQSHLISPVEVIIYLTLFVCFLHLSHIKASKEEKQ